MNAWRFGNCVLPLLLAHSACGSDHDDDAQRAHREPELEFGACPSDLPGVSDGRECATTEVPLSWDEPDGGSIELLVARYPSATPNHGQLWLLDGGPGGTGAIYMFEEILPLYASLGLDVYVPQHRIRRAFGPTSARRPKRSSNGSRAPRGARGCSERTVSPVGQARASARRYPRRFANGRRVLARCALDSSQRPQCCRGRLALSEGNDMLENVCRASTS